MIQILKAPTSWASDFAKSFAEGATGGYFEGREKAEAGKKLAQSNEQIKKQYGIDLSGITDPNERKAILTESLKQAGKKQELKSRQDYANQLFGFENQGEQQQQEVQNEAPGILSPEYMDEKNKQGKGKQFEPTKIEPNKLLALSASGDTQTANLAQRMQDTSIKRQTEEEKLKYKRQEDQKKHVNESFKENDKYINKVYDSFEDAQRKEAIFDRMDQLEESGDLSNSGIVNLLEKIGFKPEWLQNPANEEYSKLALDLLGGGTLQADYGSRVLASEFKVSLQRIPTLSQTPEGRKQIKENLRLMLLPAKLKQERMQYYIDKAKRTGKPLPHDLRGQVLKDIKPQLDEAYDKFKQRNGRYKVALGTEPDIDAIDKYFYLTNGNDLKAKQLMREDGYDVSD